MSEQEATQQPGGGMAALERDVRGLSPAQVALGEVELIQQYAEYAGSDDWAALATKLGNIGVVATRLHARLQERDAAAKDMLTALEGVNLYSNDDGLWLHLEHGGRKADFLLSTSGPGPIASSVWSNWGGARDRALRAARGGAA